MSTGDHRPRKRRKAESLADIVLREKLEFLSANNVKIEPPHDDRPAFEYLLRVCLAVGDLKGPSKGLDVVSPRIRKKEEIGDYDFDVLRQESIHPKYRHVNYNGPIAQAELPSPKLQGICTTRDVRKGELLCTSVPTLVVPCLAAVDDPSPLIFSDLSRAELTALLIHRSRGVDGDVCIRNLEYVHKESDDTLEEQCTSIIRRYTWALDHPHTDPNGAQFKGQYTKVAGHAFHDNSGWAGKFNHSCVPNTTMVSYGIVQFFYANVDIKQNIECCVSYGYDPIDSVDDRRRKLEDHAGFLCDCPLCEYESRQALRVPDMNEASTDPDAVDVLCGRMRDESALAAWTVQNVCDELRVVADLMDGRGDIDRDINILKILSLYPEFIRRAQEYQALDYEKPQDLLALKSHLILLHLMLYSLQLPREPHIGIAYGDSFRSEIHILADYLELDAWRDQLKQDAVDHTDPAWWRQEGMCYTACF